MARLFPLALFALLANICQADILTKSATRSVTALTTGGPRLSDSTTTFGSYSKSLTSVGVSDAGTVTAAAKQTSSIPDPLGQSIAGVGEVAASVDATGRTGYSVVADSFFEVFFEVDLDGVYSFDASIEFDSDFPPFGGFVKVELLDVTHSLTLESVSLDAINQGTDSILKSVALFAGTEYSLFARVRIDGGAALAGPFGGSSTWDASIQQIPEPSSALLLVSAATCCTIATGRFKVRRWIFR